MAALFLSVREPETQFADFPFFPAERYSIRRTDVIQ